MVSRVQSSALKQNSSSEPSKSVITDELTVFGVAVDTSEADILHNIQHNYVGAEKVSRRNGRDGKATNVVAVKFRSKNTVTKILNDGYIFMFGRKFAVGPCQRLCCFRCKEEGHLVSDCPQTPLTEKRFNQLANQQKEQIEQIIKNFEEKWNAQILSLRSQSGTVHADILQQIVKSLKSICQEYNQQCIQKQHEFRSLVNQLQYLGANTSQPN